MEQDTLPLIEIHYLPCIRYISMLSDHREILLEQQEHFIKQTYRKPLFNLRGQWQARPHHTAAGRQKPQAFKGGRDLLCRKLAPHPLENDKGSLPVISIL
jgi:hypothetical protein